MTEEDLKISELGAYTNNSMNREGLKKLVDKVNSGGSGGDAYTKAETDALLATKQGTLTAGDNVAISEQNVISATDTKYTAGTNVEISEQNVISATDTKYTAGTGIAISEQNVISAIGGGGEWSLRTHNYDWSDLFEVGTETTPKITAKKDIIIFINQYYVGSDNVGSNNILYIPKNLNVEKIIYNTWIDGVGSSGTNAYDTYERKYFLINYRSVSSSNTSIIGKTIKRKIDFDNKTITLTTDTNNSDKSAFIIYTKD